jgi:hypothetical protein
MKFQVGDKVIVLHSGEEGEIVDFINDKMVMVDVRGVRFPAYMDQLDFPYFRQFTEQSQKEKKKQKRYIDQLPVEKKSTLAKVPGGVWLTVLPQFETNEFGEESPETLKIHLLNNSEMAYQFSYALAYFGKSEFNLQNQVHPFQDFYLHDIPFADLNDSPVFTFTFSLLNPDKQHADKFETSMKLKPRQVFTQIEEIKSKGESTFSYKLFDRFPDRTAEEPLPAGREPGAGRVYNVSEARKYLEPPKYEVDLHIERLTDDWQSMSNFEILSLQIQVFEKNIDLAIAHHQGSLVVIHGVGKGRLRDEIHELLRLKKEVKSFVNQYDPRYGYGATEIYFQY